MAWSKYYRKASLVTMLEDCNTFLIAKLIRVPKRNKCCYQNYETLLFIAIIHDLISSIIPLINPIFSFELGLIRILYSQRLGWFHFDIFLFLCSSFSPNWTAMITCPSSFSSSFSSADLVSSFLMYLHLWLVAFETCMYVYAVTTLDDVALGISFLFSSVLL